MRRIQVRLSERGEDLVLIAEAPVADRLSGEVRRRRDPGVLERHLQRARALEHLSDVHDVRSGLPARERLRHPREREVHRAIRQLLLGHDVDAALDDVDVQAPILVEALLLCGEVAGELCLDEPLQLQLHRVGRRAILAAVGRRAPPASAGAASVAVIAAACRAHEHERQHAGYHEPVPVPLHVAAPSPRSAPGAPHDDLPMPLVGHHAPSRRRAPIPPGVAIRSNATAMR